MDRKELEEYVERSTKIVEDAPQMDEANTKKRLVEPFVEDVLGWDGFSDVELEHSVQMGRNPKKVDYALTLEDTPVVFVEAKGLDESLSEREEDQLRSYMRQVGVDWGVLTNGKRFEFLKRKKDTNRPEEVTFGDLELDELLENVEVVRTVSKESVKSGESEKIADEIQKRRRAVSHLREQKDEIAESVVGVVTERVGESVVSAAETEAKEFVDRVVEELENGGGPTAEREPAVEEVDSTTKGNKETQTSTNRSSDVVFTAGETVITSFDEENQSETMAKAVKYLIDEYGLLEEVSLPYVPGNKKAVLNKVPKYPNGDEMRYPKKISGIYLDVNMNKNQKEKVLSSLAGKCGLGVEFNW